MAEWELSKENIQPLKHGRKMATLNNILQVSLEEFNSDRYLLFTYYLEEELPIPFLHNCSGHKEMEEFHGIWIKPSLLLILYILS